MGKKGASTVLIVIIIVIAVAGLFFLGLKIANNESEKSNQNEELENNVGEAEASLECLGTNGMEISGLTKEGAESYSVILEQRAEQNPADGAKIIIQNPDTLENHTSDNVEFSLDALDLRTINSRFEGANFGKGEQVKVIVEPYILNKSGQKQRCDTSISKNLEVN